MYYDDDFSANDICRKVVKEISSYTDFLMDFYPEWRESGADTITPYLEELTAEQLAGMHRLYAQTLACGKNTWSPLKKLRFYWIEGLY